jgi:4-hydroxybenzoate polyprenyltransferase
MADQTFRLILQSPPDLYFSLFVFFSTICSYSFHGYLTDHSVIPSPRIAWIKRNRNVHLVSFFIGLAGSAILFFKLLPYWHWLIFSAFITFLYSAPKIPHPLFRALRKVALGKTIFLAGVWTIVTTLLPIIISGQSWRNDFTLFIIHRFFLVYTICILFDYRDKEDDKADGIHSLITYMNEKNVLKIFIFSLFVFALSTIMLYAYDYSILSLGILLTPGIILGFIYKYAINNFNDIFYYLVLDGLMAFSAFIMLIAGI